uniref:Reverse transcriptase domain-containing protein n=1 Tax=Stephanosphaera pluvialis TaxID=51712 RepID=A0A0S2IDL6_9CHLO|nr:hypothetical protein [Stephanosphaera pluvialis]
MKKIKIVVQKRKVIPKKLRSTAIFNKKVARQFIKLEYYITQNDYIKKYEHIEAEKKRLATPRSNHVTMLLNEYKRLGYDGARSSTGTTLYGIYKKNKEAAINKTNVLNTNLIELVAKPQLLLLAYREIRGNKGALTRGAEKTQEEIQSMDLEQQAVYAKSNCFPDGFSIYDIMLVSRLIRKGKYPWGISSRIYIDNPGAANEKRPITIPPFLDRIVQKAIELVLQSIYEPYFDLRNRSFGFRPNKGVHDAIVAILSNKTNGARTAVEGDIEAAYDTVNKERLLEILGKKVHDKKFLRLIEDRLDYEYKEKETSKRFKPKDGIPQGGIDSPYLFNIYMNELDEFVGTVIQEKVDAMNAKRGDPIAKNKHFVKLRNAVYNKVPTLKTAKKRIKKASTENNKEDVQKYTKELFARINELRKLNHKRRVTSSVDRTKTVIRIFYVRYADDWILLTNGTIQIGVYLKNLISKFLANNLKLKLSENKTLITDITKDSAHFLGFEIRGKDKGRLRKMVREGDPPDRIHKPLARASGLTLWTAPDRQRLITRLHMKGYCKKDGFPIGIPLLSVVEPQVIIERYNTVIRGMANYYTGYIRNTASINRWVYILRYSCLKTLAQKYRTTIGGIFKKFGHNMHNRSTQTLRVSVQIKVREKTFEKSWTLLTYKDIKEVRRKNKGIQDFGKAILGH